MCVAWNVSLGYYNKIFRLGIRNVREIIITIIVIIIIIIEFWKLVSPQLVDPHIVRACLLHHSMWQ